MQKKTGSVYALQQIIFKTSNEGRNTNIKGPAEPFKMTGYFRPINSDVWLNRKSELSFENGTGYNSQKHRCYMW